MSNPNIVPRLQPDLAYFDCPLCEDLSHPGVMMRRSGPMFVCTLNHQLDLAAVQRYAAMGRKINMAHLEVVERPTPTMVKAQFDIYPETLAILQQKFKGRMIATMNTFFAQLCEWPDILIVGKEDAAALRKFGIHNAKDMLAACEGQKELEETHKALIQQIAPILNAAQAAGSLG